MNPTQQAATATDPAVRPAGTATRWWDGARDVFEGILAHPFLTGLADGTLPGAAFEYYLVQDAHYLRGYARALSLLAARAPGDDELVLFARSAVEAIEVERSMHTGLLAELGIDPVAAAREPVGPATTEYVDWLTATVATGSWIDGLAAVLPCYWVYAQVGERLQENSSPDPRYARWIATYADPAFQVTVAAVLDVVDRVGAALEGEADVRAGRLYRRGVVHEWAFWDAAWTDRRWPAFGADGR